MLLELSAAAAFPPQASCLTVGSKEGDSAHLLIPTQLETKQVGGTKGLVASGLNRGSPRSISATCYTARLWAPLVLRAGSVDSRNEARTSSKTQTPATAPLESVRAELILWLEHVEEGYEKWQQTHAPTT